MKRNRFYAKRKVAMRDGYRKKWQREERRRRFLEKLKEIWTAEITDYFFTPTPFWEYLQEKQWVSLSE